MNTSGSRFKLAVLLVVLLLPACVHRQESGTPAAPSASSSGDVALTRAEVQAIVVAPRLDSDSGGDLDSPRVDHDLDDRMSEPCRAVLNQDNLFGTNWSNFKNRAYYGASNLGVSQSIAVYPDAAAAKETFERMKRNFNACAAQFPIETFGDAPTLSSPDARTLIARYPGGVNGPGSVMVYRVDSQVLIFVGAYHYSTDSDVAHTVLDRIEAKINKPV